MTSPDNSPSTDAHLEEIRLQLDAFGDERNAYERRVEDLERQLETAVH